MNGKMKKRSNFRKMLETKICATNLNLCIEIEFVYQMTCLPKISVSMEDAGRKKREAK